MSFNSDDGLIYGFEDSVTSANIPEQINGVTVKGFGTPFSTDNGNIGIQSMTYVKLPSTIAGDTDIGWIQISPKLTTIEVDANHTSFSSTGGVLFDKNKETLLVYPQGKTETSYSIPNSVTKIGENAFIGNVSLTDINIPTSVTQIDNGAFRSCAKLSSIAIPDSVTKIGANAFWYCADLTTLTLGKGVTDIGTTPFTSCLKLAQITIDPDNTSFCFENGVLFNTSKTRLIRYLPTNSGTTYEIPGTVSTMDNEAFANATALTKVTIPSKVTSIGESTFSQTSLTEISIPNTVASIGSSAFQSCTKLSTLTIPGSVDTIGSFSFSSCSGLTTVTISEGVKKIAAGAFSNCSSLTKITIPNSVTDINQLSAIPKTATIYGKKGSYAETYAKDNGYTFVVESNGGSSNTPGKPTTPSTPNTPSVPSTPSEPVEDENTTTLPNGNTATTEKTEEQTTITVADKAGNEIAKIDLPAEPDKGKDFTDVKDGSWYKNAIDKATGYGIFNGVSETKFAPKESATRGMIAQTLYNLSGKTGYGTNSDNFTDAKGWYQNAVNWAASAGVVSGNGNGKFEPNEEITREQLVVMLYNFAQAIGADTNKRTSLSTFPDSGKVSGWANNAMQWAVAEGLMNGSKTSTGLELNPRGTATRAEVATVLVHFVEYLK